MEPFVGQLMLVGFNFAPRGYAAAAGQIMSIAQNSALFSLLGTTYGGNGQTTFALPNLNGRLAIGQGQGPGTSNYSLGEVGGVETTTLNSQQLPQHTHVATTTVTPTSTLSATTAINALAGPAVTRAPGPAGNMMSTGSVTVAGNALTVQMYATPGAGNPVTLAPAAATTALAGDITATAQTTVLPTGGSLPIGILQPFLALNYIIAVQGIFPSRN